MIITQKRNSIYSVDWLIYCEISLKLVFAKKIKRLNTKTARNNSCSHGLCCIEGTIELKDTPNVFLHISIPVKAFFLLYKQKIYLHFLINLKKLNFKYDRMGILHLLIFRSSFTSTYWVRNNWKKHLWLARMHDEQKKNEKSRNCVAIYRRRLLSNKILYKKINSMKPATKT